MLQSTDRRNFLQSLASVSLCAFSFGCERVPEAVGPIAELPSTLPHLDSIRVYPAANYQHILVHVRQAHESNYDELVRLSPASLSSQTLLSQTSIRNGIGALLKILPGHAIYVEGLHQGDVSTMRFAVNGFRDVVREQERFKRRIDQAHRFFQSPGARDESELEKLRIVERGAAKFDDLIKQTIGQFDRTSISHSTAIQIAANYNLVPESPNTEPVERFLERFSQPYTELEQLNKRAIALEVRARSIMGSNLTELALSPAERESLQKLRAELYEASKERVKVVAKIERQLSSEEDNIFTLREEAVVSLIAARPFAQPFPDTSLVLFGARHDFRDEVRAHNRRNPDNAIALVVVTPKGLEGDAER